ncbi:hypothetical protein [Klebsiella variicola]|uniref:hypothetical protein n=1 Tax=Klebsiella sp. GG_Kp176 TaxID=3153487 RepID=UPI001399357C|nr:hypothetical protein GZS05_17160 [Klebsiella variicola]HCI6872178.1 hypothetical protein [Klebsiella variicola subsp. variicola]
MPNRNRKEINTEIFARLLTRCDRLGQPILNSREVRYISSVPFDRDIMTYGEAESTILTNTLRFTRVEYQGVVYYVLFGLPELELNIDGLSEVDLTAGIFCLSVYESGIPSMSGYFEIKDCIEDRYSIRGGDYLGHDFNDIKKLFPSCKVFMVNEDSAILKEYQRALGVVLCQSLSDGALNYQLETLNELRDLFETGSAHLPFRNIINGMIAISWDVLFLQLYRCIEQLYAQPKTEELRNNSQLNQTTHSLVDIAEFLETYLAWRPKEEEALQKLFVRAEESISFELGMAMGLITKINNDEYLLNGKPVSNPCAPVASAVYKLRNSIVHYRPSHDLVDFNDDKWNSIVCGMVKVIKKLYGLLGESFFVRPAASAE